MIGTTLGGFRIIEQIGQGATSRVYKGESSAGVVRAVKVYKPHLFETGSREREHAIQRETRLRDDRIAHPNVCRVYGWGRETIDGTKYRYLICEFVEGVSLERMVRASGPLAVPEFLGLSRQITEGLRALHDASLVHRDVKPGNVLIEAATSRAVLADFGVVRDLAAATALSSGAEFKGTWHYASPEAIENRVQDRYAHKSDIYSLGATFYEMITGARPFADISSLTRLADSIRRDPLPIVRNEYPRRVLDVVRLMLAKDVEVRPSLEDVLSVLSREEESADPPTSERAVDYVAELKKRIALDPRMQDTIRVTASLKAINAIQLQVAGRLGTHIRTWAQRLGIDSIPLAQVTLNESTVKNSEELPRRFPDREYKGSQIVKARMYPPLKSAGLVYLLDGLPEVCRVLRFFGRDDDGAGLYLEVQDGVDLGTVDCGTVADLIIADMDAIGPAFRRYLAELNEAG